MPGRKAREARGALGWGWMHHCVCKFGLILAEKTRSRNPARPQSVSGAGHCHTLPCSASQAAIVSPGA